MGGTLDEKNCLNNLDDESLVDRCLSGEKEACDKLCVRYVKEIFRMSYRFLYFPQLSKEENLENAKDATQTIFQKVFENIKNFRKKSRFKTWLYRIAINCLKEIRKKIEDELKKRGKLTEEGGKINHIITPSLNDKLIDEEEKMCIRKAIATLPDKYKILLILRFYEDKSYKEMAEIFNIPEGTVKSRLNRAIEKLKEELKKCHCI